MSASTFSIREIGRVESTLRDPADAPKQGYEGAPDARIRLAPAFRAGLDGIAAGDEVLVLTWLHRARRDLLAVHPRDEESRPLTGVFATRSADRPNPIGSTVTVLAVEQDGTLLVRGLEAVDATPVIDLKPALAQAGGW